MSMALRLSTRRCTANLHLHVNTKQVSCSQYTQVRRHPQDLADPDSRYMEACNLGVHYKVAVPVPDDSCASMLPGGSSQPAAALALLHGLGANAWSWEPVQQLLAKQCNAVVTAHCMPGLGLTERTTDMAAFSLQTNGHISRRVQHAELERMAPSTVEGTAIEEANAKRILVGHSLGCAGIAASFIADPSCIAGLVLVAPAIMANPFDSIRLEARCVRCVGMLCVNPLLRLTLSCSTSVRQKHEVHELIEIPAQRGFLGQRIKILNPCHFSPCCDAGRWRWTTSACKSNTSCVSAM